MGDEGHGRHRAGVPTGLGALRHDEIAARLDGGQRMADLAAHVDDDHVVRVAALHDVTWHTERGDEHRDVLLDHRVDAFEHLGRQGSQEVDTKGFAGQGLGRADLVS